ncbi:MAG: flagellar protein FliT [Ignavibacteriales bacterium]
MEPDRHQEILGIYTELFHKIHVLSQKQLELIKSTDMDEKDLTEFNRLTDDRQSLIDRIDALPISIDELRDTQKFESEVQEIETTGKAILDNDKTCRSLMQEKMSEVGAKLNGVRSSKKTRKAYGTATGMVEPWFLDTKK